MIYLVRHGQTNWNIEHRIQGHLDIPLNETGRNEADICGKRLASVRLEQIISSDLSRARETADIINAPLSLPIKLDARLRELRFGDLEGVFVKDITDKTWDTFNHKAHQLNAESLAEFYERVKSFFEEVHAAQNTLIVTHGGVIRMARYLSCHPDLFNQSEFENTCLQFKIKNTGIFIWDKTQPLSPLPED